MLPAEIFDIVADFLHADKPSLIACSLCRPLLPSARYHLFSEVSIQPRTERVLALLNTLLSPSNTISPYVERITFTDLTRCIYVAGISDVKHAIRKMPRVLAMLPYASRVRISNTDFEHIPQEITHCLVTYLQAFASLELHSLHFFRFSEFADLVCAFPQLRRIEIKRLTWTHNGRSAMKLGRVTSDVEWHVLELRRGEHLSDLAEWLEAHHPAPIIRSFYYDAAFQPEV
ncbi:hypothetical protein GYMLUDRAFT_857810 [Collybiopsis luxurians FD-317 M1]|nr:hypothetical protein GYMLUDRAFT_857810 [Collybiopsis luxurians FD-317 M1]